VDMILQRIMLNEYIIPLMWLGNKICDTKELTMHENKAEKNGNHVFF